eukprot:515499_1
MAFVALQEKYAACFHWDTHKTKYIIENNQSNIDKFCLCNSNGLYFWLYYDVGNFIKQCPENAFGIVCHCHVFEHDLDYSDFETKYGFGSFYEELVILSYSSPLICLQLCEESMYYHQINYCEYAYECMMPLVSLCQIQQLNDSLTSLPIPYEAKDVIFEYLFNKQIINIYSHRYHYKYNTANDKIDTTLLFEHDIIDTISTSKVYEQFSLNTNIGSELWYKCNVPSFIRNNPLFIFEIIQQHQTILSNDFPGLYHSDLYQDIIYLASDDPAIFVELCKCAYSVYEPIQLSTIEMFILFETNKKCITIFNQLWILFVQYLNDTQLIFNVFELLYDELYVEDDHDAEQNPLPMQITPVCKQIVKLQTVQNIPSWDFIEYSGFFQDSKNLDCIHAYYNLVKDMAPDNCNEDVDADVKNLLHHQFVHVHGSYSIKSIYHKRFTQSFNDLSTKLKSNNCNIIFSKYNNIIAVIDNTLDFIYQINDLNDVILIGNSEDFKEINETISKNIFNRRKYEFVTGHILVIYNTRNEFVYFYDFINRNILYSLQPQMELFALRNTIQIDNKIKIFFSEYNNNTYKICQYELKMNSNRDKIISHNIIGDNFTFDSNGYPSMQINFEYCPPISISLCGSIMAVCFRDKQKLSLFNSVNNEIIFEYDYSNYYMENIDKTPCNTLYLFWIQYDILLFFFTSNSYNPKSHWFVICDIRNGEKRMNILSKYLCNIKYLGREILDFIKFECCHILLPEKLSHRFWCLNVNHLTKQDGNGVFACIDRGKHHYFMIK